MLTRGADFKMAASVKEKVYCVLEHAKTSSVTVVQRHFRTKFAKEAPYRHNIRRLVKQFEEMGCLCKGKRRKGKKLNVPQATVWRMLRKHLQFKPYKFQMVQALKPTDRPKRRQFCVDLQERLEVDGFEDRLVFTDEATFHLCGKVSSHNLRFWGTETPCATLQHERDSAP
jgi:hypothetical protein